MKIIELQFYNINNLKGGPHIIPFNRLPLSNAGLFAIIGPTGSGKSTILDVITLALFNRIPRFKKSISRGEINELGSVITHHTDSAYANITYEVNHKQYTSKWRIEKARTGNLKDYEMHITDHTGNYLDIKKSDIPSKNEEIIGLNYSQFIKSIILSQGQFSKFLKAEKNERGQLLENITGSTIYRKIGREAYTIYVKHKKQVDLLNELLGEIQVLSEEKIKEIKNNVSNFEAQQLDSTTQITMLSSILQIKKEIKGLQESIATNKKHIEVIDKEINKFQPELLKLATHEKLISQKDDIVSYRLAKKNADKTKNNIEKYEHELDIAHNQLERVIQELENITKEKVNIQNFTSVISSFEKEIQKMDSDLDNIKTNGESIRNRINQKLSDLPIGLESIKNPEEARTKIKEYKNTLNSIIQKTGFDSKTDTQIQRKIVKQNHENLKQLHDLLRINEQLKELINNRKEVVNKINSHQNSIDNTAPLYRKTENTYKALVENESNLQKRKEDALKIANLENLRESLIAGDPCPLCGSELHPYTEHNPNNNPSKIDIEIAENKKIILKEQKELNDLDRIINAATTSLTDNKYLLDKIDESIKKNNQDIEQVKNNIDTYKELKTEDIKNTIDSITYHTETIEEALIAIQNIKVSDEISELYKELQNILHNYQEIHSKRTHRYKGQDPSKECHQLQELFNIQITSKTENTKALEIEKKDYDRSITMLNHIENKLQPKLKSLGLETIEEMDSKFLSAVEFEYIKSKHEKLTKEYTTISATILNDENKLTERDQSDTMKDMTIYTLEEKINSLAHHRDQLNKSIGEHTARIQQDIELRNRRKEKEKEINKINKLVEKWSIINQLIGDATGNTFANFAQGLTLQNLLVYTNKRLINLTDRYLIDMPKGEGALTIIDQYQGNTVRSVSTLSGGETFLISLALALSLSDMASKNISLESLFIDEGFGTLDQETLDIAIDTLEKLQSENQKTVGIISHVEALKERINVQIKLEKNAQGYSHIEIVS